MEKEFYTVKEAAELLRISKNTATRLSSRTNPGSTLAKSGSLFQPEA